MNSASRIKDLVSTVIQQSSHQHLLTIWGYAFGIDEQDSHKNALKVIERLQVVHQEIAVFNKQMQKTAFKAETYAPIIDRLERAFSPQILNATWGSAVGYLSSDTVMALQIYSEALPCDEEVIDTAELNMLLNEVDGLEAMLESTALPDRLIDLIKHHIAMIRKAMDEYLIVGAEALRDKLHTAAGEFHYELNIINENKESPEIIKLKEVWGKVQQLTDDALNTKDQVIIGNKVIQLFAL
jgi:hypothetical protein